MENSGLLHCWDGAHYELTIELGDRCAQRLDNALRAIWDFPTLDGCYPLFECGALPDPSGRQRASLALSSRNLGRLHGIATLPDGVRVPCRTVEVRGLDSGVDWLSLCIPLEILHDIYDPTGEFYAKPFWRVPIADWLAEIGKVVYGVVPFRLALVGMEASADKICARRVAREGIPAARRVGYLYPSEGVLQWYPINQW